MPKTKDKPDRTSVRSSFIKITKLHVLIGIFMAVQLIIYDASKLVTPEVLLKRWIYTGILVVVASICWYFARLNKQFSAIRNLAWVLIMTDIIIGALLVYSQRGMASKAIILFILPILVAGALHRMGAIYLTAILAVVAYTISAISYFVLNFNEGYKTELYGEIIFYSSIILVISAMVWTLVKHKH